MCGYASMHMMCRHTYMRTNIDAEHSHSVDHIHISMHTWRRKFADENIRRDTQTYTHTKRHTDWILHTKRHGRINASYLDDLSTVRLTINGEADDAPHSSAWYSYNCLLVTLCCVILCANWVSNGVQNQVLRTTNCCSIQTRILSRLDCQLQLSLIGAVFNGPSL